MSSSVERPVARDRHAMTVAAIWKVIPQGLVLHAPIVPERDRIRLPAESALELGPLDMAIEHLQQRDTLRLFQLDDSRREHPVDEERVASANRMGSHHRMLRAWILRLARRGGLPPVVVPP